MKLSDYLKKHKLTHGAFADVVGVARPFITNISNGKKNPSLALVHKIQVATKGDVTFEDLFNPEAPSKLKVKIKKK